MPAIANKTPHEERPQRRVYGRRAGRTLRKGRAEALENKLDTLGIPKPKLSENRDLDPTTLFADPAAPLWMEIGFGTGEHLNALLTQFPDKNFIGAEPFINGMSAFLKDLDDENQARIRVLMDDAIRLVRTLTDQSLDRLYVLNPDPWPKKRHHKRRIINQNNLSEFARVLKPGAQLVMATDVDDLAEWMVTQCMMHPAFTWTAENKNDWQTPPPEWIETRFAEKGKKAGRTQTFLIFEKST